MKQTLSMLLPALALAFINMQAAAETWPAKPLRAIVPFGAGGSADIIPRIVFEHLAPQLGQNIVVENRTGAGGTIGSGLVARASPDGYTILATASAITVTPSMYANPGFHPARDFAAVVPLGVSPIVLVVAPAKGFKTAGNFVAAAKAKPGAFNFSSVGIGTATHMSAERFRFSAGIEATHVPYKGGLEAIVEVMAGRVDFFFGPVGVVLPNIREGKLTALAVSATKRSAALPDVPTTHEAGYPNSAYPIWYGLFVPAKTPQAIVDKLHSETGKALQAPKLRERLAALGVDPMVMTRKEFDALVQQEIGLNATLVKTIGLKPE